MAGRVLATWLALSCAACGAQPPPADATAESALDAPAPLRVVAAVFDCEGLTISVASEASAVRIGAPPDRTLLLPETGDASSGSRHSDGTTTFQRSGTEATFTMDGRTYVCRALRDPWLEARSRGIDFRAIGQEPGWYLEIDDGTAMRLVYEYGSSEAVAPAPPPVVTGGRTTYSADAGGLTLEAAIEPRLCHDGMSGQPFSHAVTVAIGPTVLRGCGRSLAPRPDGWTASAQGVGAVRVGMTRAQAEAVLSAPLEGDPGANGCVYLRSSALPEGVRLMGIGGLIVRVDITAPGVPTAAGVEVGAFAREVHAAYGPGVTVSPHKYTDGQYLTIARNGQAVVFETDREWVTRYRVGRVPEVEWVEGCS